MKRFSFIALMAALAFSLQAFSAFAVPASSPSNEPHNIFAFEKNEVPEIYFTNQSAPIYLLLPADDPAHTEIITALSETKAIRLSSYNPNSGVDTGFFIVGKAGKKNINLRPGNIIEIDGVPYGTTTRQYTRLLDLGNGDYNGLKKIPQWCAFMNYSNIVKVEYSPSTQNNLREIPAENVMLAAKELHGLAVKEGRAIFPNSIDLENWANRTKLVYTFENGVQYIVYANNAFLFIESKGMAYSCRYSGDFSAYVARARELAVAPVKPGPTVSVEETKQPKTK